jgi:hypothetical protein
MFAYIKGTDMEFADNHMVASEIWPPADEEFVKPWSGGNGGNCVEAAFRLTEITFRDSKVGNALLVPVSREACAAFVAGVLVSEAARLEV